MNVLCESVLVGADRTRRRLEPRSTSSPEELARRADRSGGTVWRVQPVIEICAAERNPDWRQAREKRRSREGTQNNTRTWPNRLMAIELAGVFLPQSHGGHYRDQPAEIALPVFSRGTPPPPDRDFEHPYEPLVLRWAAAWTQITRDDPAGQHAVLLAPPLVDLIASRPRPGIPHELGIAWPLEPN